MSGNQSLHQYYQHQLQHIGHCLEGCLTSTDPELVHRLRLSIKKLRALDILVGFLAPDGIGNDVHLNKDTRALFKTAGELRDIQVQIQLLASFEEESETCFPDFEAWLLKREKKRILRLAEKQQHAENHNHAGLSKNDKSTILELAGDDAIQESARKALTWLYARALELLRGEITNACLHEIRTVTKQMRYIYSMVQHSFPGFSFEKCNIEALREIEVTAGHWHDCLVRVELYGKFVDQMKNSKQGKHSESLPILHVFTSKLEDAYKETCALCVRVFF